LQFSLGDVKFGFCFNYKVLNIPRDLTPWSGEKTDSHILELAPSSIESYYSLIFSTLRSYVYVLSVVASVSSANLNYGFDQAKIGTN
jgi:hypothetical protein